MSDAAAPDGEHLQRYKREGFVFSPDEETPT